MIEPSIKLHIDFQSMPAFRRLQSVFSVERQMTTEAARRAALCVWVELFIQLGYQVRDGNGRYGSIHRGELTFGEHDWIVDRLIEPCKILSVQDGEWLTCASFAELNTGLRIENRTQHQRGADMRAFQLRMRSADEKTNQQLLHIPSEIMVDEGGVPMDSQTVNRVRFVIVSFDNALFLSERPAWNYNRTIVQLALAKVREVENEPEESFRGRVIETCRRLVLKRGHAALNGMVTERLLTNWTEITEKVFAN
jgi:hypothetical protein